MAMPGMKQQVEPAEVADEDRRTAPDDDDRPLPSSRHGRGVTELVDDDQQRNGDEAGDETDDEALERDVPESIPSSWASASHSRA